ncbi:MAG TPA: sigma factor-like helix-turn-helix DNA-binding protein, partial [Cytophagales bacterium]|nr:sigma factor-like helix-turn-helix DNA-binding protein [Cytophagales bacterium]
NTRHVSFYSKTIDLLTEMEEGCPLEEKINRLYAILAQLESEEVQLLEWRFYEELSFKEIGYLLDIKEDNAKVRTYRVLDKVRKHLLSN